MKIHLIIFGICCILCFGVCQEQKDAKIDSTQQQTAQINAYSTNKLVTPLEKVTDIHLVRLLGLTQTKLESKRVDEAQIKEMIKNYFEILEEGLTPVQVYSIPIRKMAIKLMQINISEYGKYAEYYKEYEENYQNYFLEKNKFLIDSINAKMNALKDISTQEYELFKELKSFASVNFLRSSNKWWEEVEIYYQKQNAKNDWNDEEVKSFWQGFLASDCASDLKSAAYNNIPLEQRNALLAKAESICQKEIAFVREYFEPMYVREEIDEITGRLVPQMTCFDSDGIKFCRYKIKKPLKIKGTLKIARDLATDGDCKPAEWIAFKADSKKFPSFLRNFNINLQSNYEAYKVLEPYIPQWFKDNLAGEIVFKVEIEAGDYEVDGWTCNNKNFIEVKNVKIVKNIGKKPYDRKNYEEVDKLSRYNAKSKLTSEDSYVNLRESPNGKILKQIKLEEDYLLWNLSEIPCYTCEGYRTEDGSDGVKQWQKLLGYSMDSTKKQNYSKNSQWLKVLYFPPNVEKAENAIIGYIHKSQIKYEKEYRKAF